jgi:large subunit ribosomal protein L25
MRVPLHFVRQEEAPAVKTGGLINHVLSEIDVACLPKDLPEFIEIDLSQLQTNQTIRALDIQFPAGVKPMLKGKANPVVVSVTMHGEEVVEEEATAAPVAAVEVPATAQKAPPTAAAPPAKGEKERGEKGDKDKKKK